MPMRLYMSRSVSAASMRAIRRGSPRRHKMLHVCQQVRRGGIGQSPETRFDPLSSPPFGGRRKESAE